jgi:hypothetical protein
MYGNLVLISLNIYSIYEWVLVQKIIFTGGSSESSLTSDRIFYKAETAAHNTDKVFPVPVGLSINAFCLHTIPYKTASIIANWHG